MCGLTHLLPELACLVIKRAMFYLSIYLFILLQYCFTDLAARDSTWNLTSFS